MKPGPRGGFWHYQSYRRWYFRQWRAEHAEYRERERQRQLLNRAIGRLVHAGDLRPVRDGVRRERQRLDRVDRPE